MADMADTGAAKRVLLVDDHGLIREGLRRAFDRTSDLLVVAEAGNCKDAMQALQDVQLDVLVTDLGLPDGNGMDLVRFARAGNAKLGIVVLTMYSWDEQVVGAMEAHGFEVRDVESLREHYARTLRCWVANLEEHFEEAVGLVGMERARVWRLYMAGSANGFDENSIAIHQVLGVKTAGDGSSGMPATRRGWD